MADSTARRTLDTARFYLKLADAAGLADRLVFLRHLETAIVWARSSTYHLQKEYAAAPGFESWWSEQQVTLRDDRRAKFFHDSRNLVLHVTPLPIRQNTSLTPATGAIVTSSVDLRLVEETPSQGTVTNDLRFTDPEWSATPALTLLSQHLDTLQAIVAAADTQFGTTPASGERD